MILNRKKIVVIVLIAVVAVLGILYLAMRPSTSISAAFTGTYSTNDGAPNVVYFSADLDAEEFFYADQANHIYINGTVRPLEDDTYQIVCTDADDSAILEGQTIHWEDNGFQLVVSGQTQQFQKTSDMPTVILHDCDQSGCDVQTQ